VQPFYFIRFLYFVQSSSSFASFEDASTSGRVVFYGQHDESDSPRTPKSRLGMQERTSRASLEDSALNLAEVIAFELLISLRSF
jgi:serine/threonine-protein kinase 24/25/MST4